MQSLDCLPSSARAFVVIPRITSFRSFLSVRNPRASLDYVPHRITRQSSFFSWRDVVWGPDPFLVFGVLHTLRSILLVFFIVCEKLTSVTIFLRLHTELMQILGEQNRRTALPFDFVSLLAVARRRRSQWPQSEAAFGKVGSRATSDTRLPATLMNCAEGTHKDFPILA